MIPNCKIIPLLCHVIETIKYFFDRDTHHLKDFFCEINPIAFYSYGIYCSIIFLYSGIFFFASSDNVVPIGTLYNKEIFLSHFCPDSCKLLKGRIFCPMNSRFYILDRTFIPVINLDISSVFVSKFCELPPTAPLCFKS